MLPGFDANLIGTGIDGGKGGAIVKVDIGHNGDIHRLLNGRYHRGICRGGHRDAHDLAARFCHAFCLLHVARISLTGTLSMVSLQWGWCANGMLPILTVRF